MNEDTEIVPLSGGTDSHSSRSIVSGIRNLLNTLLESQNDGQHAIEDLERGTSVFVNINVSLDVSRRIPPETECHPSEAPRSSPDPTLQPPAGDTTLSQHTSEPFLATDESHTETVQADGASTQQGISDPSCTIDNAEEGSHFDPHEALPGRPREVRVLISKGFFPPTGRTTTPFSVCHKAPSEVVDLYRAIQEHNAMKWIFTPEQRARLHKSLFLAFRAFYFSSHGEIFDGCLGLLRNLQSVGLLVLAENTAFQVGEVSLQDIVTDVHQFTEHLSKSASESDIRDFKERDWEDKFWDRHLNVETDVSRETSLEERIAFKSFQRLRKKHYRNLLCDVIFGALHTDNIPSIRLPSPAADGLVVDQFDSFFKSLSKCRLKTFLNSVEFSPRAPEADMPELDALRLDAKTIESRGPFRFKATTNLEDHLTITPEKVILFYFQAQHFAPLYFSKVLHEDSVYKPADKLRLFDLIVYHYRAEEPLCQVRTGVGYLYDELYRHYYLFFGQEAISQTSQKPRFGLMDTVMKKFRYKSRSSTGYRPMAAEQIRRGFEERLHPMGHYHPQQMVDKVSQYRKEDVFKYRLDSVHETLRNWTPQTVFELRYIGYGSVDPVNRYILLFSLVFGGIAIAGLSITAAQAYVAFKQLNFNGA